MDGLKAKIDYPLLKENREIELTKEDEKVLEEAIDEIISIKKRELPPEQENQKICKKCAYYELCFI